METVVDECGDGLVEAHYNILKAVRIVYASTPTRQELCETIAPIFLERSKYWHEEAKISPFQRDLYEKRSQRLYEIGNYLKNFDYQTSILSLAKHIA